MMKRTHLLPLLFLVQGLASAAALQPGSALPPIADLKDQHGKPVAIAADTKLVFFAHEMGGSRVMTKALDALPPNALKDKHAVYIADISGMPAIFTTIVALPRLQKSGYTVGLIRNAKDSTSLPGKPGAVTVLRVDAGTVSAVEFVQDARQIKRELK